MDVCKRLVLKQDRGWSARDDSSSFGEDVEGGPSYVPGSDVELVKKQIEDRRRQQAERRNGPIRRGTAGTLWAGQPKEIAEEYSRVYEERLVALQATASSAGEAVVSD